MKINILTTDPVTIMNNVPHPYADPIKQRILHRTSRTACNFLNMIRKVVFDYTRKKLDYNICNGTSSTCPTYKSKYWNRTQSSCDRANKKNLWHKTDKYHRVTYV